MKPNILFSNFQVHFYPVSGIWELRIKKVGVEDVGEYECQANTEPKREFSLSLGVADTVAVITGPKEVFLKAGSQLRLHCVVDLGRGPDPDFRKSAVLHWFLNQRLIDPGAGREKNIRTATRIGNKFQVLTFLDKLRNFVIFNFSGLADSDQLHAPLQRELQLRAFLHHARLGDGAYYCR